MASEVADKFRRFMQSLSAYESWQIRYRIWIEDSPWSWEYRLIHGEEV